jgi:hypothetical protein
MLLLIASSPQICSDVQWLAAVYAKNQVSRYWKQILPRYFAINPEEKTAVRSVALPLAMCPNGRVASQAAQLISKIVFFDYPRHWPDFLHLLMQSVSEKISEGVEPGNRALTLLHFVLKCLSSKKLLADKKEFFQISAAFFPVLSAIWLEIAKHIHDCPQHSYAQFRDRYVLCCKILRRILAQGSSKLFTSPPAVQLLGEMTQSAEKWATLLLLGVHHHPHAIPDDRCPYFLLKCLLHVLDHHALAMAACLEPLARVCAALAQRPKSCAAATTDSARLRAACLHILAVAAGTDGGRAGPTAATAAAAAGWFEAAGQEAAARDAVVRALGGQEGVAGLARSLVSQVEPS